MCRDIFVKRLFVFSFIFVFILTCTTVQGAQTQPKRIITTIAPQKFFLEKLVGPWAEVVVMVKPGQTVETFEPSAKQMSLFSHADVIFTLGLDFEKMIYPRIRAYNPLIQWVELKGYEQGVDPHLWLDPLMMRAQLKQMFAVLLTVFAEHREEITIKYQQLDKELEKLHEDLSQLFTNPENKQRQFIIFHPALSCFARRYRLQQIAIEVEGKPRSARQMAALLARLKQHQPQFILLERNVSHTQVRVIAQSLGLNFLWIDPLAENYFENMRQIGQQVKQALF